ncbi:toxin-antitoxin system YwqK family antitoxin [Mucilaginibacter pedocola]|uniref:TonB C-terminal domain-containing protein n=1 Tax=Mucilaginibacter pedocola TaxID=1792845 RepID=A0A1S9PK93_9SPHI|nr:hypothetical protein [Mucilaginibacter pedocola]OOQ61374.1 hypothetical protein BC343_20585 [Mucilaginibacter pedocola]
MKSNSKFVWLLLSVIAQCLSFRAFAQSQDSTIYLFRNVGIAEELVSAIDSADFYRVIPPFTLDGDLVEVNEYYINGRLRSAGKVKPETIKMKYGKGNYEGTYIKFDSIGKRQVIINYSEGVKIGLEYRYYPDGKTYAIINNTDEFDRDMYRIAKVVAFYDRTGNQICTDGEGMGVLYDRDFKPLWKGPIKNGKMEGNWVMAKPLLEGIIVKLIYKDGIFQSGETLEPGNAKPYLFDWPLVKAKPQMDLLEFVQKLKKKIKLSSKSAITSKIIDSMSVSFEVKPDGEIADIETVTPVSEELMNALKLAMGQSTKWEATKVYGIPLRTRVTISLGYKRQIFYGYARSRVVFKTVDNLQEAYYDGIEVENLPAISRRIN